MSGTPQLVVSLPCFFRYLRQLLLLLSSTCPVSWLHTMPTSAGVYRKKLFLSPCWSQNYTAVFKQKKSEPIMCFETVTMFHPPEKNYCSTPLGSFSLEAKTSRNGRLAQDLCGVSKVRRLICVVLKAEGFPHSYSRCVRKPHGQWGFNLDQCRSYNHASHTESYRDSLTLILCTDLMKNSNSSKQMKHGFHSCAALSWRLKCATDVQKVLSCNCLHERSELFRPPS